MYGKIIITRLVAKVMNLLFSVERFEKRMGRPVRLFLGIPYFPSFLRLEFQHFGSVDDLCPRMFPQT